MGELSAEQVAQRAFDLNLIDERQLQEVWGEFGRRNVTGDQFLQHLVRRELLTNFQVERMLRGERTGFFYGDYKVLYMVAAGTFARVYRAVHKDTGKIVALKVLRRRYSDDTVQTDQFYREGEMGKTLVHPNIVPIFDVYSEALTHFLVMEFVEGYNLREFLRVRHKFSPAEATKLTTDIVRGLQYAHERGITHRDMKLTNVLVSSRGQAKLVDFGLAGEDKEQWANDEALAECTNPRAIDYAGLERVSGARKNDPRSDLYFVGCIYYHILSGKAPLQETRDRIQRLSKSRFLDVRPIHELEPDLPPAVVHVVKRSLLLDPERRYQSPAEMIVDLKIASRRMDEPASDGDGQGDEGAGQVDMDAERQRMAAMLIPETQRRAVMFVESNVRMQDLIRGALKRSGYRVLVTSDPERALDRFNDEPSTASAVIFSTGELGSRALDAFNQFGENTATQHIPAVLLLGEDQSSLRTKAEQLQDHRVVLAMPIKLRQFRAQLAQLMPPVETAPQ